MKIFKNNKCYIKKIILSHYVEIIGFILILFFLLYINSKLDSNWPLLVDSDMSSELVYAELLSQEGVFISDNWYSSTSVEIVGTSQIQSLFFRLGLDYVSTRIAYRFASMTLIAFGFVYLCKQLKIRFYSFFLFAFIGTFSLEYYNFVVKGNFYSISIIFSFFSLGLFFSTINEDRNRIRIIKYLLLFAVSCVLCLDGIRNVTTLFFPMFVASILMTIFINKKITIRFNKYIHSSTIAMLGSTIGYFINKLIILKYLHIANNQYGLTREALKEFWNTMYEVIVNGWLKLFGFDHEQIATIVFIPIIAILIYAIYVIIVDSKESNNYLFITLFFIVSACVISSTFFVSSLPFHGRYLIQSYVFSYVILAIFVNKFSKSKIINTLLIVLMSLLSFIGFNTYYSSSIKNTSVNADLVKITKILQDNDISTGYAYFWNANVITELSNGEIEVWSVKEDEHHTLDINTIDPWLQKTSHNYTKPKDKNFIILTKKQAKNTRLDSNYRKVYDGTDRELYISTK